jgi:FAD/FMN-containing dehydrogenase
MRIESPFVVLPSSHARAHERFPASQELEAELRRVVRGEIRFDAASRALYATDASNYRHIPIGLVLPRDEEDVVATVAACRRHGAPILSRGAGTSLAGQACNAAVILDFSKYMHRIGAVDPVAQTVHVQPGAVLDRVREAAEKFHLTFAPDPATHSRCTLGGMIGNNSCGVHALMGGKTVDNIVALDLLLYDGTRMRVGATSEAELAEKIAAGGRTGDLYAGLKGIRDTYAEQVRNGFPRIPRRVSGYNLDELLPESGFHVARALVGSEGTCAIVLGATLRLVRSPEFRTLVGVGFPDIFLAADSVPLLLQHPLIGREGMDGNLLDALRATAFCWLSSEATTRPAPTRRRSASRRFWPRSIPRPLRASTPPPRPRGSGTFASRGLEQRHLCLEKAQAGRDGRTPRSNPRNWGRIFVASAR